MSSGTQVFSLFLQGYLLVQDGCWCSVHHNYILDSRKEKKDERDSPCLLKIFPRVLIYHMLTFHWPELDHKATTSWKVAGKRRAKEMKCSTIST